MPMRASSPPGGATPGDENDSGAAPRPLTIRNAIAWAAAYLEERQVPGHRLDAELLAAKVLQVPRHGLLTEPDRLLTSEQRETLVRLVRRRGNREPLQYVRGWQEFWSLEFAADPKTLIPRPETELVVETALAEAGDPRSHPVIVDMGSGSGNISVALAVEIPAALIVAVDRSPDAAARTRDSARTHRVESRVLSIASDLFEAFGSGFKADVIVSNPPYIASAEVARLQPEVSMYEPRLALDGGSDGLDIIRRLLADSGSHLRRGGRLVFEAGGEQAGRIGEMVKDMPQWVSHRVVNDLEGRPRVHVLEAS